MGTTTSTNRRAFLKSTAFVAAPLAAFAAPAAALADDGAATRLSRIEDERAIEALHRAFLKDARGAKLKGLARPGESLRSLAADPAADPAPIEFAEDGARATARHSCSAQVATDFKGESTIEQMARLQGNAEQVREKRCVILAEYRKEGGQWALVAAWMA